jgi:hypothetical protein
MKTSITRALVMSIAVLTLGTLSMTKVSGGDTVVTEDKEKVYGEAYKKAYEQAKAATNEALAAQQEESSGGSCG